MSTTTVEPETATAESVPLVGGRVPDTEEVQQFDSLEVMRDEHTRLLKLFYADGATPNVVAQIRPFLARGQATGTSLDRPDERLEAQRILDQWGTVILKAVHEEIDATLAEFKGKDLSDKPCPYVGLRPFDEQDHALFFGRNRLRKEALQILGKQRFLAILGPSGSGKSSLVLGGILPDLRQDAIPSSASWIYVPPLVPGPAPLESLLSAFQTVPGLLPPDTNTSTLLTQPQLFSEIIRPGASGRPVVVIIDQFEETFTLCEDPAVREAFARSLLALVEDQNAAHRVILTMRSDFEPRLALMPELQARFLESGAVLRALPLTQAELREAIEGPARAVGLHFHREVIDALLKDVGDEMAGLPLLQFTLRKLWDTKRADRITLSQYTSLGGAKGALAKSADEFYLNLVPEEQVIAKRILLRMVRLGEGLEVTSARIRRASLYELGYDQSKVDEVAGKLVESGLIRVTRAVNTADDQLEVAHEAMVRNWRRFVRWLEEDRANLLTRRRLDDKAAEWVRLGSGPSGLLDEVQLQDARKWLETTSAKALGFHPSLPALIEKSQELIDAAKREKELAEKKLLEQTRLAVEEQRQRRDAERELDNNIRFWEVQSVGRRMRRVALLALCENIAIAAFFAVIFLSGRTEWGFVVGLALVVIALGIGIVVVILAFPAMTKRQSRVLSSSGRKESLAKMIASAQARFRSPAKVKTKEEIEG